EASTEDPVEVGEARGQPVRLGGGGIEQRHDHARARRCRPSALNLDLSDLPPGPTRGTPSRPLRRVPSAGLAHEDGTLWHEATVDPGCDTPPTRPRARQLGWPPSGSAGRDVGAEG